MNYVGEYTWGASAGRLRHDLSYTAALEVMSAEGVQMMMMRDETRR